jgi:hypothetical protein
MNLAFFTARANFLWFFVLVPVFFLEMILA